MAIEKLIVGLRTPGEQNDQPPFRAESYDEHLRHNIGATTVRKLREAWDSRLDLLAEVSLDTRIVYAQPLTFMNNSGMAVRRLLDHYRPRDVLILFGDASIKIGKIRLRKKTSDGNTHNGIRSTLKECPTAHRLKIGLKPADTEIDDLGGFVTSKFTENELRSIPVDQLHAVAKGWTSGL